MGFLSRTAVGGSAYRVNGTTLLLAGWEHQIRLEHNLLEHHRTTEPNKGEHVATLGEQGLGIVLTVLLSLPLVPLSPVPMPLLLVDLEMEGIQLGKLKWMGQVDQLSQLPLPSLLFTLPL